MMYLSPHHKAEVRLRRVNIDLPDALHEKLEARARAEGINVSELISRLLEIDGRADEASAARAFFLRLTPLESFAEVDAEAYVAALRNFEQCSRAD